MIHNDKIHDMPPLRWMILAILLGAIGGMIVVLVQEAVHGDDVPISGEDAHIPQAYTVSAATTVPVYTPPTISTCFAPEMKCADTLVNFMKQAQVDLDVAIYDINYPAYVKAIEEVNKRANVRVVVDKQQSETKSSLVMELVRAGVPVKYGHQRGIMHNKFTIVDREAVETGSFNYTDRATIANHENQIYVADLDTVRDYVQEFETMWAEGTPVQ